MMSNWVWRIAGVPAALFAGMVAVLTVGAAEPSRNLTVTLPYEYAVVPDGSPTVIRGMALDGADLQRVAADMDGRAVPLRWSGDAFDALLPPLRPGAHALRMGIVHQGGVRREFVVPVVSGPFAARGEWIDNAITLQLALDDIDSGGTRTDDLASALSRKIMATMPTSRLGALVACPITIRPSHDRSWFVVGGEAFFELGSIAFTIPLRFRRPTRQQVSIARAGRIRATPDERALQYGRDQGSAQGGALGALGGGLLLGAILGGPLAALLGMAVGQSYGEDRGEGEVRFQARTELERVVDGFLPRVSGAMVLPEQMSLGLQVPGTTVRLRFHAPPRFVDGRGLVVRIDAQVECAAAAQLPGPLAFAPSDQLFERGESGITASPELVAALADAYGVAGGADRDLAGLSHEGNHPRRVGPLEIRGTRLVAPPMLTSDGQPGAIAWAVPDLALTTNLPLDARIFATGTITARLAPDGRRVLARPVVRQLNVSCRERAGSGWSFLPCLSDATNAVPDAPARLTRAMPEVPLFGDVLGRLADAPIGPGADLSIWIRPSRVELGDSSGAPRAALAASVTFEVP